MVSVHYEKVGRSPRRGGFADVWKAEYRGRDVAVKVIRTYSNRELRRVIHVGPLSRLIFRSHLLTAGNCIEVLQGGCNVEVPSTPECPAPSRGDGVRESVRNGI